MFERKTFEHHYDGAIEPFAITDNVYFVGCFSASSHLIDTSDGLILIDTGYADNLFLLVDSIYKLGFKPTDVKYILHTHWHGDHTEATAGFVKISGAKTLIGEYDAKKVSKYFTPDILLKDNDKVTLGNTVIDILHTPGHTEGCISPFFNSGSYRVGMFGGAGANTLKDGCFDYEKCREGYRASLNRLRQEKVDVFIGNHVWNNDTEAKGKILRETGENKFIDPNLFGKFLDFCEKRLDSLEQM